MKGFCPNAFPVLRVRVEGGRNFTSLTLQIWGNLGKDQGQEVDVWKEEGILRRSSKGVGCSHPIVEDQV